MPIAITRDGYIEELLTPAPDGLILEFQTSIPYESGSVHLWYNGMLLVSGTARGYTELDGTGILLNRPPRVGDTLEVRYSRA